MLGGVFHEDDFLQNGRRHSYTAICPTFINTYLFVRHIRSKELYLTSLQTGMDRQSEFFQVCYCIWKIQTIMHKIYWDFSGFASKNVWSSYTESPDEPQNPLPKFQSCSKQPFQPSKTTALILGGGELCLIIFVHGWRYAPAISTVPPEGIVPFKRTLFSFSFVPSGINSKAFCFKFSGFFSN